VYLLVRAFETALILSAYAKSPGVFISARDNNHLGAPELSASIDININSHASGTFSVSPTIDML
jgi:hypothetical protein